MSTHAHPARHARTHSCYYHHYYYDDDDHCTQMCSRWLNRLETLRSLSIRLEVAKVNYIY